MEANPRSEFTEQISEIRDFQNGHTREFQDFLADRQMGGVHRFQGRLLPYTNKPTVQEIPADSHSGSILPIQSMVVKEVKVMAQNKVKESRSS